MNKIEQIKKYALQPATKTTLNDFDFLLKNNSEEALKKELQALSPGISTGYTIGDIDLSFPGGAISIVAAPTSHGKTSALINFSLGALAVLNLDLKSWFLNPQQEFINKGALVEAFIGQELLAYLYPTQKSKLFYWRRNTTGSEAEVDYLMQINDHVIPVEVKSGSASTLKSMNMFLENHANSSYGIRFSTQNYSVHNNIRSYPLYAVIQGVLLHSAYDRTGYEALING